MRCAIVAAEIRLEFDDAPDAATRLIVPDESRSDERPSRVEGRVREDRPVDDRQASG